jgi:hypothetical protein
MDNSSHGYETIGRLETVDYTYIFIQPLSTGVNTIFAGVLCDGKKALTFPIAEDKEMSIYSTSPSEECVFCGSEDKNMLSAKGIHPVPKEKHTVIPYNQSEEIWVYFCEPCWLDIYDQFDVQKSGDLPTIISRKF